MCILGALVENCPYKLGKNGVCMDALTIAKKIYEKLNELEGQKVELKTSIQSKVNAQVDYDKALALEILKLRDKGIPISIVEKVAKGNIWEKTLDLERSEGVLKGVESNIRSTQAQLNGLQSINKYFAEV